jgi:hypothetical protein
MAETPYLVDSNILLRWVKPNHRDYPLIVSATDAILRHDGVLCFKFLLRGRVLRIVPENQRACAWHACDNPCRAVVCRLL